MWRDSRPSLLVKYTQCRVYGEDRERRGRWQMKEALITSERECLLHGYLASMGQIHPKNAPGRTDRFSSFDESQSCVSIGNGSGPASPWRHTIRVLECGNDSDVMIVDAVNNDRKGQPATDSSRQVFHACREDRDHDPSPSSAHHFLHHFQVLTQPLSPMCQWGTEVRRNNVICAGQALQQVSFWVLLYVIISARVW